MFSETFFSVLHVMTVFPLETNFVYTFLVVALSHTTQVTSEDDSQLCPQ